MNKSAYMISLFATLLSIFITGCFSQKTQIVDLKNHLIDFDSDTMSLKEVDTSNHSHSSKDIPLSISAADDHSLVVDQQGELWIWGTVIKDGNAVILPPGKVIGVSDVESVAGSSAYTLVQKQDGTVWGWGSNLDGQLGDGTNIGRDKPVQALELENIQAIDTYDSSSIALKQDGTVWTWGDNLHGQLGVDRDNGEVPVQVPGLQEIVGVAAGSLGSLALQEDGTLWAWGYGNHIDLNVENEWQELPSRVKGIGDVVDISARGLSLLALKKDGTVWEWGGGGSPARIQELNNIISIEQGLHTAYAIHEDGTLWTWQVDKKPEKVPGLFNIVQISAGDDYAIAVDADGNLWSWGDNTYGQLGDGTTVSRDTPVKISLEKGTPIENDYTDQDVFTVKYDNTEINFSIEFPPSWKGKYLVKQEDESVDIYHNTTLEDPTWIMSISTTSSEIWREHPPEEYPWDKLGEKDGIVIVYHQLAEQAYPLQYRDEEDEVMSMLYDIKQVKINIMD